MKQLIIPIVIGLLAGLGGGTGYSYMKTSAKYTADSTHLADSLKAHPPADSTHADSTHGEASHDDAAAHDSVPADSASHGMDSPGAHEAAAPMTPADSIRLLDAARRDLKSVSAKPAPGKAVDTHAAPVAPAMAMRWPGSAMNERSRSTVALSWNSKLTFSKATRPTKRPGELAPASVSTPGSVSRISKMRFAPASETCALSTTAASVVTCVENCWRRPAKATRPVPRASSPRATIQPP